MYRFILILITFLNPIFANESFLASSDIWILVALFSLAIVSITILFISSKQMQKVKLLNKNILKKKKEIEYNQTVFLTTISEDIHNLTKTTLKNREEAIGSTKGIVLDNTITKHESQLLDTTESLIEYLRLKSKKIKISKQKFNLNNVLNEISGSLASTFKNSKTELIFDVDHDVEKHIIGDSVYIGHVLTALLRHSIEYSPNGEVKLEISVFKSFMEEDEIQFKITDTGVGLDENEIKDFFRSRYNEENSKYKNLDIFVAYELVELMSGNITIQSTVDKGSIFILTLPFKPLANIDKRKYRLPNKDLTNKKVLIVDTNHNSALAIKKMFSYFKHQVQIISTDEFIQKRPTLSKYDIVILYDDLFDFSVVKYIQRIKEEQELKVIALSSMLKSSKVNKKYTIIDQYASKPFSQGQIFDMIIDLYIAKEEIEEETINPINKKEHIIEDKLNIHKDSFVESPNISLDSFYNFSGTNLLIVEDNNINQKLLINILGKSNMNLTIANNGKEALDILYDDPIKFNFVLMDINMPIMDGYEATQRIREDKRFDNLPIVALSALVLENEINKMFHSGVSGYLQKPISIGMLYSSFELFLHAKGNLSTEKQNGATDNTYGINTKQGIAHLNGNIALYQEVLREFISAYGNSDKLIVKLIKENNYEELINICLDLKGLSGTIGAYKMHNMVDRMHQSLVNDNINILPDIAKEFENELPKLKSSIMVYIG